MVGVPGGGGAGGGVGVGEGVGVGGGEGEALRRAAAEGNTGRLLALIEEGASVNKADECGYTALQRAACEGHVDIVRQLIKHNANVDHQDDQHGNTALHEAAWKGYSHTAEALVRAKANVYIKNKGGFAPLHLACQNGHNQTCRVLLLAGCRPDIKNNYGDTPLHTAARYGHAGVTRILLSARSHVAEMNKNGDTALHIAAAMGRRKLTKIMLESGADQTIKNKQNEAPGDIAKRKEFDQILEILKNPPPIVSVEERLRREQEQKKREAKNGAAGGGKDKDTGKGDKKRGKTNDSGTSSKDSSTRAKEKKKHKAEHKEKRRAKQVQWSPYGCQYYPPLSPQDLAVPNIDSLPKDPLGKGEQYFIDLAGNIKKGPVGVGYTCYCAPFFKNVEDKLEKDKVALMDHIDAAHDKLDAKITNLEHRTKSHIQHLSDNVKQKLADEKEECRQRVERTKVAREVQADSKMSQLQQWVERRLASRAPPSQQPQILPRSFMFRGSVRRPKEPPPGHYPLSRSRSEEAISEYREEGESDRDSVYKGLRVLDHPTSMYNIPQTVHDEHDAIIYDAPRTIPSLVPGILRCPSPTDHPSRSLSADSRRLTPARMTQRRSHSLDARNVLESSEDLPNGKGLRRSEGSSTGTPVRDVLNESASSDMSAGQRGSRSSRGLSGSSMHGSPVVRRMGRYSPANPSPLLRHPDLSVPPDAAAAHPPSRPSPLHHTDLNQAVDNLRVSQSHAEHGAIPKTTMRAEDATHGIRGSEGNHVQQQHQQQQHQQQQHQQQQHQQQQHQPQGWSGYSRYDYRNNNPYMHGDLRGRAAATYQPQVTSTHVEPTPAKVGAENYMQYPKYPTPPEEGQTAEPYQPQPGEAYGHTQTARDADVYYTQNAEAYQSHTVEAYHTQTTEEHHNQSVEAFQAQMAQAQEEYDAATYLDMDRYRIQQAVRRLYDGYLAEGRLEAVRGGGGRNPHESSMEHDSHNDSGYSTRLCTGSQGPSPALSGGHEMLPDGDVRPHHGAATPEAGRCAAYGDAQRQELGRGSLGEAGKVVGPEAGYPAPPGLRYNNGLPPAVAPKPGVAPKFSTPNLSGDTIIIGESSLV